MRISKTPYVLLITLYASLVSRSHFRLPNQGDDLFRPLGSEEVLSHFRVAHQPAGAGEESQMLRHGGCDQQEKQLGGLRVYGAVRDALVVPAKNNHRLFDEADEGIAGMGQGDTVADSCAVELLAFLQGAKQDSLGFGAGGDFRNPAHQLVQHVVPLTPAQTKLDGRRGYQIADQKALGFENCHRATS